VPTSKRLSLALVAAAVASLAPCFAFASPVFPQEVQEHLGLSFRPCCTLCHAGTPSFATVQSGTPFGMAVLAQGVGAAQTTQLDAALDALEQAGTDSDGDHKPDIQELTMGMNPNGGGVVSQNPTPDDPMACDTTVPVYGCAASTRPVAAESGAPSLCAIATALLLVAAARSRRRR
jgi:hypothetical protein